MGFFLVAGISMSIGHDRYYHARDGNPVGNEYHQQFAHGLVSSFDSFVLGQITQDHH
jgi:hypothetical protein